MLSAAADADVRLKLETTQPTGSFKIRGAFNAALRIVETAGATLPHVVTASAGNHGRAFALAAQEVGLPLTVYVPERTEIQGRCHSRDRASLRACRDYDTAERTAKERARVGDGMWVSPQPRT